MLSLQFIRENPDLVREGLAKKRETAPLDEILSLDKEHRTILQEVEELKAQRNAASRRIGQLKDKAVANELIESMRAVSERIKELDDRNRELEERLNTLLLYMPNLPHPSVPDGPDESGNQVIRKWGCIPSFEFTPLRHWEIAESLDIIDFARGTKITGSGFILYKGLGARLERAIINWMLDLHSQKHGYLEVLPPFLASRASMTGTTQLPKYEFDMYRCEEDDLFLVPTAEVPVTNICRDEILSADQLPMYMCAYTPCFRREAGAAGKDTRGLLRVHEFNKVELVKYTTPETSYDELEKLTADAEEVLQLLGLPYHVLLMCSGDTGFGQAKKYDLEVWAPGVGGWLEVSSCSNYEDFQSRRANIRYRPAEGERPRFVHTMNGSGVALPRTVVAILENYQQADGTVAVPEVLRPYMGGASVISGCR